MKALRNDCNVRLKYYAAGEYGDKTGRPHYHSIIFGLGFDENKYEDYGKVHVVKEGVLKDCWYKGNIVVGTVTLHSMRYVADYIQKRLYDDQEKKDGRVQPFSLMSKKLGARFALEHGDMIKKTQEVYFNGQACGLPRYYAKILDIEADLAQSDKEDRHDRSKDREEFWRRCEQYDKTLEAKGILIRKGNI